MQRWIKIGFVLVAGLALAAALGWFFVIQPVFLSGNTAFTQDEQRFNIPEGTVFDTLLLRLEKEGIIRDISSFRQCARFLEYGQRIRPGSYLIRQGESNLTIVRMLRAGNQTPVKLIIHNLRTLEDLAGRISTQIECDSLRALEAFRRSRAILPDISPGEDSLLCLFIPNTYEVYWNISPEQLMERMADEYDRFWTSDRTSMATSAGLTPNQIYILASIVEKETLVQDEKSTIAGVYMNRLRQGIPLQADPTVVFARQDFSARRVLFSDLEIDSPYNTYKYAGLPPGPICMPQQSTLLATLNAEQHQYIYFCAKADGSGRHAFAKTLAAHNRNARDYQQWLNARQIYN
ncbi:MAG: endolytic transglycosylase MltG [Lewinellaceae bacterium]|nr:endolytic transglycosylase MltG [Saprospiraceae bacterium]MCB9311330.1 endolytic transglycosylase MltG [Lewinellaceae bacterium]